MIAELQAELLKMPQAEIETTHTFCNGVYAREITIPTEYMQEKSLFLQALY